MAKKTDTKKNDAKKPRYVLVLEENDYHAELLTDVLDRHFAPVIIHIVDNVDAAFDFLNETSYQLILCDSSVGGVPVIEHIKELSKRSKGAPIIVVTGRGDESLAAKLIKKGANEYLVKTKETLEALPHILEKYFTK